MPKRGVFGAGPGEGRRHYIECAVHQVAGGRVAHCTKALLRSDSGFVPFVLYFYYERFPTGAQSCLTLCHPMDYTVHGILQARLLEWGAFPFSRGSSQPRDRTQVSCIAGGFFLYQLSHKGSLYYEKFPAGGGKVSEKRLPFSDFCEGLRVTSSHFSLLQPSDPFQGVVLLSLPPF